MYRPSAGNGHFYYDLLVAEPVLQGYVQHGLTQITLLPTKKSLMPISSTVFSVTKDAEYDDSLEIDEAFLANAIFSGISSHPLPESRTHNGIGTFSGTIPTADFVVEPVSRHIDPVIENYTVLIRTSDLLKVGLCDGDWVGDVFCSQRYFFRC